MVALLKYFRRAGIKVATLKHHGHGGMPHGIEMKDSTLHHQAGAIVAGVEGEGVFQLVKEEPWKLEELINVYQLWEIDLLLIEGFKGAEFEKIVLLRDEKDRKLLGQITNVIAVVAPKELKHLLIDFKVFQPKEQLNLAEWLMTRWRKKL